MSTESRERLIRLRDLLDVSSAFSRASLEGLRQQLLAFEPPSLAIIDLAGIISLSRAAADELLDLIRESESRQIEVELTGAAQDISAMLSLVENGKRSRRERAERPDLVSEEIPFEQVHFE